ncbi:MAG: amidohydrolase [Zavarzinella sp.]
MVDAQTKWILPGFIDAHAHPQPIYPEFSRWYVIDAGPDNCATLEDLIAAIKRKAKLVPRGQWILGRGYQETKLGRHPTKMDLDLGTTDHPVLITHSSGHLAVCNSAALKSAGISAKSRDPSGGAFDRDKNGEPTGLLKESAVGLVRRANPAGDKPPEDEVIAAYRTCFKQFLAKGITSVHVAGISPDSVQLMQAAHKKGAPIRLMFMLRENYLDEAIRLKKSMANDELNFRFGSIKLFHGNSLSGQTCWLSKPYAHRPDYFGIPPARSQESLNKLILRIHQTGLQACVHANGDREISMLLDAYEYVLKEVPRQNHRHRIEHCSVVTQKILDRIKDLELVVAPHSYVYEHGDKMENYGEARWDWMHANRKMIDQGTVVAGNSDYPVSSAIPMLRIHDLVNRTSIEGKVYGPKQKCTVEQSIQAFTFGGAYAEFMESKKGTIAPGMLADMVVLDADPMNTPANKLKDIQVLQTFVGGKQVYPEIQ